MIQFIELDKNQQPPRIANRYVTDVDLISVDMGLVVSSALSVISSRHIVVLKLDSAEILAGIEVHKPCLCKGLPESLADLPVVEGSVRWVPDAQSQDFWEVEHTADYYLDSAECVVTFKGQEASVRIELGDSLIVLLTSSKELAGLRIGKVKHEPKKK